MFDFQDQSSSVLQTIERDPLDSDYEVY